MTQRNTDGQGRALARVAGALAAGAALGAAGALAGAVAYADAVLHSRLPDALAQPYTFSPYETQVEGFEDVELTASDGVRLSGWWLPRPESRRVIVGLAGHRSGKDSLLGIGSALWRAGSNVLIFDWRSRGASQVAQHSLAYYELRDAEAALEYALGRVPGAQVGLIGYSMGASIAILLAASRPEVRAVVADSPFTGVAEVVADGVARYRLPAAPVTRLADALTRWKRGYAFGDVRPIDAVAALSPRPLLLIHGEADTVIPVSHAHAIYAAAGEPKQLWLFPGAAHCGGYFIDRPAYAARVAALFEQALDSVEV
jgi:alpha-beta hydrolase superfamily lysophospholipase